MSSSETWTTPIPRGSFYPGSTNATPQQLFGVYDSSATPEAHEDRAKLMAAWLSRQQDAPVGEIEAVLTRLAKAQRRGDVAEADVADRSLEALVAAYLSASPGDRAIAALRAHGHLAQSPPSQFDPQAFLGRLSGRGIVATLGSNGAGVTFHGASGLLGPEDQASIQAHRREIQMFLVESANAS